MKTNQCVTILLHSVNINRVLLGQTVPDWPMQGSHSTTNLETVTMDTNTPEMVMVTPTTGRITAGTATSTRTTTMDISTSMA